MRRRRIKRSRYHRIIIIVIILLSVLSVSYGYLSTQLKITGNVHGVTIGNNYDVDYSGNPNLRLSTPKINKWQEGNRYKYQYTFLLENLGNVNYDNFKMTITYSNNFTVESLLNYSYQVQNRTLIISNTTYNLLAHNNLGIDYIIASNKANLRIIHIKIEVVTSGLDPSKFEVAFTRTSSSGNYTYQYNMTLTNRTGSQTTYWKVVITLPTGTTFISGSNGTFSTNGNDLIIENTSSNGRISNNTSITVGLQINTNIVNFIPTNPVVTIR